MAGIFMFLAVIGCIAIWFMRPREQRNVESIQEEWHSFLGTGERPRTWRNLARERRVREQAEAGVEEEVPSPPAPAEEFIQIEEELVPSTSSVVTTAEQLSGKWRGYYEQYGASQLLCEFTMVFEGGKVHGDGLDDVGFYSINGLSSANCRRIAFAKQYLIDSPNINGDVNYAENLGHTVEYRGTAAGPEVTTSGLRGTWFIQTLEYTGAGTFHIWPVEGIHSAAAMEASRSFLQRHPTFEIGTENVCVICFDRTIEVLLDPCGHIAVCAECAQSLAPPRCPICRVEIKQILSVKGAAVKKADSTEEP